MRVFVFRRVAVCRKNKSFRPGTRPKKGLKNLQTVKTLTAGQNLCNPSTVKTRKQPLTVTAQFQNSLAALMDTLNQVGGANECDCDVFFDFVIKLI